MEGLDIFNTSWPMQYCLHARACCPRAALLHCALSMHELYDARIMHVTMDAKREDAQQDSHQARHTEKEERLMGAFCLVLIKSWKCLVKQEVF